MLFAFALLCNTLTHFVIMIVHNVVTVAHSVPDSSSLMLRPCEKALAPSTSLFAFAAEFCFAISVVVTTAIAKVSSRVEASDDGADVLPRTITAVGTNA
jgi:hypothetical protein